MTLGTNSGGCTGMNAYLLFRVGAYDLAVAASKVRHLDRSVKLCPVDRSPGWLAGVAEVARRGVPVVDVGARLGLAGATRTARTERLAGPGDCEALVVVVANPWEQELFPEVGLLVDRIGDTVRIYTSETRELRPSSSLPIREWVEAAYRGRSRAAYLLALERVIPAEIGMLIDRTEWV